MEGLIHVSNETARIRVMLRNKSLFMEKKISRRE